MKVVKFFKSVPFLKIWIFMNKILSKYQSMFWTTNLNRHWLKRKGWSWKYKNNMNKKNLLKKTKSTTNAGKSTMILSKTPTSLKTWWKTTNHKLDSIKTNLKKVSHPMLKALKVLNTWNRWIWHFWLRLRFQSHIWNIIAMVTFLVRFLKMSLFRTNQQNNPKNISLAENQLPN